MQSKALLSSTANAGIRFAPATSSTRTQCPTPRSVAVAARKQDDAPEAKGSFAMKAVSALAAAQLALLPFAGSAVAFDTPNLPSLPSAGEVLKDKTSSGSNVFNQLKGKVDQSADNVKKLGQKGKDAASGSIATKPVSLQFNVADSKTGVNPASQLKGKVDQTADNVKKLAQKGKDAASGSIATKPVNLQFNVADSKTGVNPASQFKGKVDQTADNVKKLAQKGKDAANGSIATKPVGLQLNVASQNSSIGGSSKVEGSSVNQNPAGDPLQQVKDGKATNDGGRDVGKTIPKSSFGAQSTAFSPLAPGLQVQVGLDNPFARGKEAVKAAVDRNTAGGDSISPDNAADQVKDVVRATRRETAGQIQGAVEKVADNLPGAGKNTSAATKPVAFSPLGGGLQVEVGLDNPFARGKEAVKSAVDRNTAGSSISPDNAADQVKDVVRATGQETVDQLKGAAKKASDNLPGAGKNTGVDTRPVSFAGFTPAAEQLYL